MWTNTSLMLRSSVYKRFCFALERGIFLLAKRTEEVRARKEASKALEAFQVELRAELEDMMQSMEQEKRTKLKEADVFKRCALR